jgi:hypothetical protein
MKTQKTKKLTIAPIDLTLNVDSEFVAFCLNRLSTQKTIVKTGKTITITMLNHKILFTVKGCEPENSVVSLTTKLRILRNNTRSDLPFEESGLNIFMTDEKVKNIISDLIVKELITRECGLTLWKQFKKNQTKLQDVE